MEKLKAAIPERVRKMIVVEKSDHLPSSCSRMNHFLLTLPLFHQMMEDLTNPELKLCAKNSECCLELKRKGNASFSAANYSTALNFYSQALRIAPMDNDAEKKVVAALFLNRASSFHKLGVLKECLRDCNRALHISPTYAKAWYRRGMANASFHNYQHATRDLTIAMHLEHSSTPNPHIQSQLQSVLLHQSTHTPPPDHQQNSSCLPFPDEHLKVELQVVHSPAKGRGMASQYDISQASLIHKEEPYAAIILKSCRETHCHFCFNELPADVVPCTSCSLPLYCSRSCQMQAGGASSIENLQNERAIDVVPIDLVNYFSEVCLADDFGSNIGVFAEHRHECHGFHWPSVLPSDVVLAGRILVKSMELRSHINDASSVIGNLDLSHNYDKLPVETRLESIIYAVVLLNCLQICHDSIYEVNGDAISKVVLLICQIKVNSMAVVRVKSGEISHPMVHSGNGSSRTDLSMSCIEQVRVGQAIYSIGSMFNHSCQPNIHAYFFCRSLLVRSTEFVAEGCSLELSYGPQVGQWDCGYRQGLLEEKYCFKCQCSGCSQLNLPDLVINSFQCAKPNCLGAVLDSFVAEHEKHKVDQLQVDNLKGNNDLNNVAGLVSQQNHHPIKIEAGYCMTCGSSYDLEDLRTTVEEAETCIQNLRNSLASKEVQYAAISNTLPSLELLKSTNHIYNKKSAEAEDVIAEAFCSIGKLKPAIDHCMESVEILKKLYSPKHIVVGNELVKLASLQVSLEEPAALDTITQVDAIFSNYYGSHVDAMFPYVKHLKEKANQLAS